MKQDKRPVLIDAGLDGWLFWHADLEYDHQFRRDDNPQPLLDQDGKPLRPGHQRGWWIAETRPSSVHWTKTVTTFEGPYKLGNVALYEASPSRFPLEIPVDEWDWEEHDPDFYERESIETQEVVVVSLEDAVVLSRDHTKALPPTGYEGDWSVFQVPAVINQAEFGPWLPGRLSGFRGAVAEAVAARSDVTEVYCKRPSSSYQPGDGPYFNIRRLWSPPRTEMVKATPRARTKKIKRETWVTIKVPLDDVPLHIDGVDLFDAIEKWKREKAEWLQSFGEVDLRACGVCDGNGWVKT